MKPKQYFNIPQRINRPHQMPLFRELPTSTDYFISGRPEVPDEPKQYRPWTQELGEMAIIPPVAPENIVLGEE